MPMQNLATNTAAVAETTLAPAPDISGTYEVSVEWLVEDEPDYHAEYYLAGSEDVGGVVLQTETLEEMVEEMLEMIPMLLEVKYDLAPIAKDRLSVKPVGKVNPRGITKYAFTIAP